YYRIKGNIRILGAQPANLVVDVTRLHRAPTRAVDAQDDPLCFRILERILQASCNIVGAAEAVGRNHAAQIDNGGMFAGHGQITLSEPAQGKKQENEEIEKSKGFEKNPPLARPLLLPQR